MGLDAQHAALRDLCPTGGSGASGGDDLYHLDLVQPSVRRPALGHGGAVMDGVTGTATAGAPRDRDGAMQPLLSVNRLVKHFHGGWQWRGGQRDVRAVDGVTFDVAKGETLG